MSGQLLIIRLPDIASLAEAVEQLCGRSPAVRVRMQALQQDHLVVAMPGEAYDSYLAETLPMSRCVDTLLYDLGIEHLVVRPPVVAVELHA